MKKLKYILLLFLAILSSTFAIDEIPFDHFAGSTLYVIRYLPNGNVLLSNGASDEVYGTGGRDADDYDVAMVESAIGLSGHYLGDFDNPNNVGDGFYQFAIFERFGGSPADTDQPAIGYGSLHWKDFTEDFPARQSDTDATDAELAKVPKSDSNITWNATALASINAEADTALIDYDGPTKAEMDTAHALLATDSELAKVPKSDSNVTWNATALASINAEADTALTDYDGPTKDEMDTAHALLATEAKQDIIDGNVDSILTLATWMRNVMEGDIWTNIATDPWQIETRLKGTASALITKEVFEIDGDNITAEYQRIGQQTEVAP